MIPPTKNHAVNPSGSPILAAESPFLQRLISGAEVYPGLTAMDFREMAKFAEQVNIMGLPVHPISRPVTDTPAVEFHGRLDDVPRAQGAGRPVDLIRRMLASEPCLLLRGALAGCSNRPFRTTVLLPQSAAHLAHGFESLMWPLSGNASSNPCDLFLIVWPEHDEQTILHLPAEHLALVLGTDDLRAGLIIVIEAANCLWAARRADHEADAKKDPPSEDAPKWEDTQILPGGSFPLAPDGAGGLELVYAGESIPDEWEKWLVEKLDSLKGCPQVDCVLAGAEPWIAEGGGWISPFWRNAPLPASLLAQSPVWASAAFHPDALPFGVHVNEQGEIGLDRSPVDAFVIVPRISLAPPHFRSCERLRVARHFTHKHVKTDAMKLWAAGFPSPEII